MANQFEVNRYYRDEYLRTASAHRSEVPGRLMRLYENFLAAIVQSSRGIDLVTSRREEAADEEGFLRRIL